MKKLFVTMLAAAVMLGPVNAHAAGIALLAPGKWGWPVIKTCFHHHHGIYGGVSKGHGFDYLSLAPVDAVFMIILSSQAFRNCKQQYPDVNDPRRANCQANMNSWVMPSLTVLDPVKPLYKAADPVSNGGNFEGGMSN